MNENYGTSVCLGILDVYIKLNLFIYLKTLNIIHSMHFLVRDKEYYYEEELV